MIANALLLTLSLAGLDPALVDAGKGLGKEGGKGPTMELTGSHLTGTRPASYGDEVFSQNQGWFRFVMRGISESTTPTGAQVGGELYYGLGIIRPEDPKVTSTTLFAFKVGGGVGLRFHTFNWPFPGALTGLAGMQLQFGGGHWWSDGRDVRFDLGLRASVALSSSTGLELEYLAAPFIFDLWLVGDDPGHGAEHHGALRLVFGEVIVGAELSQGWTQALNGDAPAGWGRTLTVSGIVGLRNL